jgi:peptidoglycan hydrolase-like protein with peptidoglycan-binding domain
MEQWYPNAQARPLGAQTEPSIGTPRIFIVHTMVGFLKGTDTMFRRQGYTGTESTFGLGGPWDGQSLDGALWQWQALGRQADAQAAGNAYATSVETSDGEHPERPWSAAQVRALIELGAWWCIQTGNPPELVKSTDGKGFGYHRQFKAWNPNNHSCPGDVRLAQYVDDVIPGIRRFLAPPPAPVAPFKLARLLKQGHRGNDVRRVQALVGVKADGIFGPVTEAAVKRWQRAKKLSPDGIFGPKSAAAAGWRFA